MDLGNPDFVKYAESYGARGHRRRPRRNSCRCCNMRWTRLGVDLIDVAVIMATTTASCMRTSAVECGGAMTSANASGDTHSQSLVEGDLA